MRMVRLGMIPGWNVMNVAVGMATQNVVWPNIVPQSTVLIPGLMDVVRIVKVSGGKIGGQRSGRVDDVYNVWDVAVKMQNVGYSIPQSTALIPGLMGNMWCNGWRNLLFILKLNFDMKSNWYPLVSLLGYLRNSVFKLKDDYCRWSSFTDKRSKGELAKHCGSKSSEFLFDKSTLQCSAFETSGKKPSARFSQLPTAWLAFRVEAFLCLSQPWK